MSALLASALAAASLASVPSSFGSEPYVVEFDSVPVHAQVQRRAESTPVPRLVASLGSEPFLPVFDDGQPAPAAAARNVPRDARPAPREATSPLQASLGSEPFLPGVTDSASRRTPEARGTAQQTLARNCHCS